MEALAITEIPVQAKHFNEDEKNCYESIADQYRVPERALIDEMSKIVGWKEIAPGNWRLEDKP